MIGGFNNGDFDLITNRQNKTAKLKCYTVLNVIMHMYTHTPQFLSCLFLIENQLATAPTNSSVVLWDLNKRTKSKLSEYSLITFTATLINIMN